jgi:hypothetical protein
MPSPSISEAVSAPSSDSEPSSWAETLSRRIKYLQETMSEDTPEDRQTCLEAELRRNLKAIPANKRGPYLEAFAEKVPSWDLGAPMMAKTGVGVTGQTPKATIAAFLQLAPSLSIEQREALKPQLATLGLLMTSSQPVDGDTLGELRTKFKLTPEDKIDPLRLGRLFLTLADMALTVDQLAWSVWRSVAPKSTIRRDNSRGDLRAMLKRVLTGEVEFSNATLHKQLESTRGLIAGLLAGLGQAGKNFARRYEQRYAPDVIREAVRIERGGSGLSDKIEVSCWKKYTEVTAELTTATIENDVQEVVVKYTEDLIAGMQKKSGAGESE